VTWAWDNTPGPPADPGTSFFTDRSAPADVLVALTDDAVVGYVKLARVTELVSNRHVLEINGLAVHPERQRQGIGRSLLDAAVDEARGRGASKIRLRVSARMQRHALFTRPAASRSKESSGRSSSSTDATSTTS
jgi:ribosomal protein S18 acetylase RimI-like enzyme